MISKILGANSHGRPWLGALGQTAVAIREHVRLDLAACADDPRFRGIDEDSSFALNCTQSDGSWFSALIRFAVTRPHLGGRRLWFYSPAARGDAGSCLPTTGS
jgi:hypothetical protein